MKKLLSVIAMVAMSVNYSIAQKFEKQQPNILFAVDKDHDIANVKVGIRTTNPTAPLEVKGEIIADSANFTNNVIIDSILQVKGGLHIGGDSGSFWFDPNLTLPVTRDRLRVGNLFTPGPSRFVLMRGFNFGPFQVVSPDVRFGVGTETPAFKV